MDTNEPINNEPISNENESINTVPLETQLDNQLEPSAPPLPLTEEIVGVQNTDSNNPQDLLPTVAPSPNTSQEINLTVDKNTLVSLCQNLNTNMLVNIAAYINVLDKLKDNESDNNKKNSLQTNIDKLNDIKSSVADLLNNVQTNLEVPSDKMVDPEKIIQDANNSNSSGIMTKLLGAELAAILSAMAAASVLMVGGSKYNRKKSTKGRRNKGNKKTKRNKRS